MPFYWNIVSEYRNSWPTMHSLSTLTATSIASLWMEQLKPRIS
jgi:hypothetical protein